MTFDLLVLGGGARALQLAARAARDGAHVALATEAAAAGGELATASFLSPFRFDVGGGLVRDLDDELERLRLPFVSVSSPFPAALVSEGTGLLAQALADEIASHGGLVLEAMGSDDLELDVVKTVDARSSAPEDVGRVFLGQIAGTGLPELGVVTAAGGYAVVRTDRTVPGDPLVSITWTGEGRQDASAVALRLGLDPARLPFSLVWQPEDVSSLSQ